MRNRIAHIVLFLPAASALCMGIAANVLSAQTVAPKNPFTCVAGAGTPAIARLEGITELVGDLLSQSSGPQVSPANPAWIPGPTQVPLISQAESLLMVDEPAKACPASLPPHRDTALDILSATTFNGVPILPPKPAPKKDGRFHITVVRANVGNDPSTTGSYGLTSSGNPPAPNIPTPTSLLFATTAGNGISGGIMPWQVFFDGTCVKSVCSGTISNPTNFFPITGGTARIQLDPNTMLPIQSTFTINTPSGTGTYPSTVMPKATWGTDITTFETSDPVRLSSGELVANPPPDLNLGGPLPLSFQRFYSSYFNFNGVQSANGFNWMHNFDSVAQLSTGFATIVLAGGAKVTFQQNASNWQTLYPARRAYQLITSGNTLRFLDPTTNLISTFDSKSGSLLKIEDRNSNTLTVTPSSAGPTQVSDGLGRTLSFAYSGLFLMKVQDQTGRSVSFSYTGSDLTGVTDANGNTTTFNYSPGDLLARTIRPGGNAPYVQGFDSLFRVTAQLDSLGNKTTFAYNSDKPGETVVTDPLSNTFLSLSSPSALTLSSFTDSAGQSGSFTYDSLGRIISSTDRLGEKTSVAYDSASGYPASITDPQGHTITFTYQPQQQEGFTFYNLAKITYADGASNTFAYDASGNALTSVDAAGKAAAYTYNSRGQVLTVTNPAGGVTTLTYNTDGTVATVTSPAGDVTTYSYDSLKRLARIQYADQTSQSIARDFLDQVVAITDGRGKTTQFAYDPNRNLKSVTNALNQTTTSSYDTDDLPSTITDPLGNSNALQYDPLGFAKAVTNGGGEKTTYIYDNLERMKSLQDPAGKGPSFTYDFEGRLASVTDTFGNSEKFTLDQLGRPTTLTSPLGENTAVAYDALGRVASATDALSRTTSFTYESRGLPASIQSPGNISTAFTWGDLAVLASFTDPNGNKWLVTYDSLGRLTSVADPLGQTLSYAYDSRNRVSSISSSADTVQISYDAAGNPTQATYSDGSTASYSYDDVNRLTGSTGLSLTYDATGQITSSNGLGVTYDAAGRITSIAYPPGNVTYSYDSRGLLSKLSDWTGASINFTFDDAHRLVTIARSNSVTTHYGYDKDSRVISITEARGSSALASINLLRDALGRVTSANRNLPQEAAPSAAGILPLGFDGANQISGFTYDARGRLAQGGGSSYTWNPASRLVSYKRADGSASFTYDGMGQRISRTGPDGTTRNYVLNYATTLPSVAIVQSGDADFRYYVYTPSGTLLYSVEASSGAHRFYSFDETGSTTYLTDSSGTVTDSYGISPYGDVITAGASNTADNPFTWQGQYGAMQEPGTSLFYLRFRYYDAAFGRFLSRDPLFSPDPTTINPYQYAAGNPVSNSDPVGLETAQLPIPLIYTSTASGPLGGFVARSALLYPFVTNQLGMDTGLVISNTATDPFGTTPQAGSCSLNWYGAEPLNNSLVPQTPGPNDFALCNFQLAQIFRH